MQLRFFRRWYGNSAVSGTTRATIATDEPFDEEWEVRNKAAWRGPVYDAALTSALSIEKALYRPYAKYLTTALDMDFDPSMYDYIGTTLEKIEKLERGEIKVAYAGGSAFDHTLTRTEVSFEHSIFNECEVWPIWSCPLAHYKAALEGWRTFLSMSDDINTELIIELPD